MCIKKRFWPTNIEYWSPPCTRMGDGLF